MDTASIPPECAERWPEAQAGEYDPRCCRFPKSCSAVAQLDVASIPPAILGERLKHGEARRWHDRIGVAVEARLCSPGDVLARYSDATVREVATREERGASGGYTYLRFDRGQTKHYAGETVLLVEGPSWHYWAPEGVTSPWVQA